MILSMILLFCSAPQIQFQPVRMLQQPTLENTYLRWPRDLVIDSKGRYCLLDLTAKKVFVWLPDGTFDRTFGQEGSGPGELNFEAPMGGTQGYLCSLDDQLMIYDGGSRLIHILGENFVFSKSIRFHMPSGRVEAFQALSSNRFLIFNSSYTTNPPERQISVWNEKVQHITLLRKAPIQTWRYANKDRKNAIMTAFSPSMVFEYAEDSGEILVGDSAKPEIGIFKADGSWVRNINISIPRPIVRQSDIDEYANQTWLQRSTFFKAEYPEHKAYYDRILSLADKGYLIFNESPEKHTSQGYWIESSGRIRGAFTLEPGESGRLLANKGRLLMVSNETEEGEFLITEIEPIQVPE